MRKENEFKRSKKRRRSRIMVVTGIILLCIGSVLIYWNVPYSPLQSQFDRQMKVRLERIVPNVEVCTQAEIDRLPKLLGHHLEQIGLVGSRKYNSVNVAFHDTKFVFDSQKGTVLTMDYDLWLLCDQPFRSAYISSSLYGIPFEGIDYCTDDKEGGMKGVIGKAVPLFDTHNQQMYKAGLISWLAEGACVNPSILLSDYLTYEELDTNHVKATIRYNGVQGSGIFTFDENGQLAGFESDERQEEEIDGVMTKIGWKAVYKNYTEQHGILIPKVMQAIKVYPDGKEVIYFDSDDMDVILL